MAKMGRPLASIDVEVFEKLCAYHCTEIEICEWFKCSESTLLRFCKRTYGMTFDDIFKRKSSTGKVSLRRKMFGAAMDGNITMMIFLSKQLLGYSDKVEQRTEMTGEPQVVLIPANGYEAKRD